MSQLHQSVIRKILGMSQLRYAIKVIQLGRLILSNCSKICLLRKMKRALDGVIYDRSDSGRQSCP